jgi:hypothetical protein
MKMTPNGSYEVLEYMYKLWEHGVRTHPMSIMIACYGVLPKDKKIDVLHLKDVKITELKKLYGSQNHQNYILLKVIDDKIETVVEAPKYKPRFKLSKRGMRPYYVETKEELGRIYDIYIKKEEGIK